MTSNGNAKEEEDLDTFLTTMESKLRGPFSSLDLAKAVTTNALRGSHTPKQYLQNVSKVLSRTDKVIQARVLIGLLGLEANDSGTNREIYHILQQAQQAPTHETWVRTVAGLVQGIMFRDPTEEDTTTDTSHFGFHRSCRGPEATQLLNQLCDEVCTNVQSAQEQTTTTNDSSGSTSVSACPDLNASFIPFRYSLLPEEFVNALIPECCDTSKNPHFLVNTSAAILQVDQQLETQRIKDELEHQGPILMKTKVGGSTLHGADAAAASAQLAKAATPLPPGFRPTKLVPTAAQKAATATSNNMFMPKKPNALLAQRQQQQTLLRRKGAAQSLVNKTKVKNRVAGAPGGASTVATPSATATAAAARFRAKVSGGGGGGGLGGGAALGRSKMKMIDVTEVDSLTKEHAAREAAESETTHMSKKRRILEAAAQQKNQGGIKRTKQDHDTNAEASNNPKSSHTDGQQQQQKQQQQQQPVDAPMQERAALSAPIPIAADQYDGAQNNEEWKIMLKERSNKLSEEDRMRVQQFFQHRYNPTPGQSIVKMKLHEQRSHDPETGQPVKETFYLELDYSNFSSKQSRKVKRY